MSKEQNQESNLGRRTLLAGIVGMTAAAIAVELGANAGAAVATFGMALVINFLIARDGERPNNN